MITRHGTARRPRKPPPTLRQKIAGAALALGLILLTVAVMEYAITRPFATTKATTTWTVHPDEELIATPIASGPLLSIDGVDHEGIDVHFDRALLDSASRESLAEFQLQAPRTEQAITWRSTSPDLTGHTTIDVEVDAVQRGPEIRFSLHDERTNAVLSLTARGAKLSVRLAVVSGGADMSATAEQKSLEFGDGTQFPLPGALPLSIEVAEGAAVQFVFPTTQPHSRLYLGAGNHTPRLAVREIRVTTTTEAKDYATYACGAKPAAVWWGLGDPREGSCSLAPRLFANELRIIPDSLQVLVDGSAWFAADGHFERAEWYSWMDKNPVLQKIGEVLIAGFVSWVGVKLSGIWPNKKR